MRLDELLSKINWQNKKLSVIREKRMWLYDPDTQEKVLSGKPDLIYKNEDDDQLLIIDFKTSIYAKPAYTNWQLRTLAVLAYDNLDVMNGYLSIITPYDYTVCYYSAYDLMGWRATLFNLIKQLSNIVSDIDGSLEAYLNAGEHCKWCAASAECPAFMQYLNSTTAIVQLDGSNYKSLLEGVQSKEEFLDRFKLWFNKQVADPKKSIDYKVKLITRFKLVSEMYDLIMQQLKQILARDNNCFNGKITLEPGSKLSKVKDYRKLKSYVLDNKLLTEQELDEISTVSLNDLFLTIINKHRAVQGLKPYKTVPKEDKDVLIKELMEQDCVETKESEPRLKINVVNW